MQAGVDPSSHDDEAGPVRLGKIVDLPGCELRFDRMKTIQNPFKLRLGNHAVFVMAGSRAGHPSGERLRANSLVRPPTRARWVAGSSPAMTD